MASTDGHWITVNGTHIFIKNGQSVADAFKATTGKELKSKSSSGKKTRSASDVVSDYKKSKEKKNGLKKFKVSGLNYKGKPIIGVEIEARTRASAAKKFNQEYGSIASKIEE